MFLQFKCRTLRFLLGWQAPANNSKSCFLMYTEITYSLSQVASYQADPFKKNQEIASLVVESS